MIVFMVQYYCLSFSESVFLFIWLSVAYRKFGNPYILACVQFICVWTRWIYRVYIYIWQNPSDRKTNFIDVLISMQFFWFAFYKIHYTTLYILYIFMMNSKFIHLLNWIFKIKNSTKKIIFTCNDRRERFKWFKWKSIYKLRNLSNCYFTQVKLFPV